MANPKEKDDGFDASALAALVTPSHAPPPDSEDDDGDDGVLDLKALAASMAPPASEPEPVAAAPRVSTPVAVEATAPAAKVEAKSKPQASARADGDSKPAKKSAQGKATSSSSAQAAPARAARAAEPARVQEVAPEPKKGGAGIWIGIGIAIAATAGIIWYVNQDNNASDDVARADGPSPTSYRNDEAAMEEPVETPMEEPAEVAPVGSETEPAVEEPVVEEPVVEEPVVEEPVATQMRVETTAMVTAMAETAMTDMSVTAPVEPAMTEPTMAEPTMAEATMAEATMTETTMATDMATMELENVLDNALNQREQPRPVEPAPAEMPDTPTRANVAQTLGRLMGQIRQCAGDQVGLANAAIIVNNDGSVASVQISGNPFGGTPQGACMEGVIRGARFAPFRQRTFQVRYPFALRAQQ